MILSNYILFNLIPKQSVRSFLFFFDQMASHFYVLPSSMQASMSFKLLVEFGHVESMLCAQPMIQNFLFFSLKNSIIIF